MDYTARPVCTRPQKNMAFAPSVGAELTLEDKSVLPVLVANRIGYQNLCRLITEAKLRGTKTESTVLWKELPAYAEGLLVLTGGRRRHS